MSEGEYGNLIRHHEPLKGPSKGLFSKKKLILVLSPVLDKYGFRLDATQASVTPIDTRVSDLVVRNQVRRQYLKKEKPSSLNVWSLGAQVAPSLGSTDVFADSENQNRVAGVRGRSRQRSQQCLDDSGVISRRPLQG